MEYSDKDVLGNNLTVDTAVRYNPIFKTSNCLTLGTSDYVELDASVKADVKKVSFWYKQNATGLNDIINCIGKIDENRWGIKIPYSDFNTCTIVNNTTGELFTYEVNCNVNDLEWHFVEIVTNVDFSNFSISFDGGDCCFYETVINENYKSIYTRIGESLGNRVSFSMCDLKLYNNDDTLVHHYPMAEGAGYYVYDAIELSAGLLSTSSLTTCWATKQDFFHYNITNGFVKDFPNTIEGLETTTYTDALVPNEEILIGKFSSKLSGSTKLGCTIDSYNYDYESDTLTFNVTANPTTLYGGSRIQFGVYHFTPITMESANFRGKTHRAVFDYEMTNIVNDQGLTTFPEIFGGGGACYGSIWWTGSGHPTNWFSSTETSCDDIRVAYTNFNSGNLIYFYMSPTTALKESTADFSFTFKVSNFRLYFTTQVYQYNDAISAVEQHPVVINGHNLAETTLDYSQGIENVAELNDTLSEVDVELITTPTTDDRFFASPIYNEDNVLIGRNNLLLYSNIQSDLNLIRLNTKSSYER